MKRMLDGLLSDDIQRRRQSSTNSLQGTLALLLTPTVGSRVILCPKQCALSIIWEDRGPEEEYLKYVVRHTIIGKAVRETDTQFIVHFEIPESFLSPIHCVRRAPRHLDDGKETKGVMNDDKTEQTTVDRNEEDFALAWTRRLTMDVGACDENTPQRRISTQFVNPSKKPSTATATSGSSSDETTNTATKMSDCVPTGGLPVVFGIVPVLSVNGEHASAFSPNGGDKLTQQLDENCNAKSRREYCAGKSYSSVSQHIPMCGQSGSQLHVAAAHNRCHSTKSLGFVHISFSIAKQCCSSLLQSILEKHNKVFDITSAIGRQDFAMATETVLSIIHVYTESCGVETDSLFAPGKSAAQGNNSHELYLENNDWRLTLARTLHHARVKNSISESSLSSSLPASAIQKRSSTNQHLGILYALLSLIRISDKQCLESLWDAMRALTFDTACLEAYTRVIVSCVALGCIQEAFTTASVALKCCPAVSPQFVRMSRSVLVYYYYSRLRLRHVYLGDHIDVFSCTRQFGRVSEVETILDKTHISTGSSSSTARTIYPYFHRVRQPSQSTASVQFSTLHYALPGLSQTMDYFLRSVRARGTSAIGVKEIVFDEDISLLIVLPFKRITHEVIKKHENDTEGHFKRCKHHPCCYYCAYPVMYKEELLAEVEFCKSNKVAEHILNTFIPKEPVFCAGGCGATYCSEICRSRANMEYHSMECDLPCCCGKEDCADALNLATEGTPSSVANSTVSKVFENQEIAPETVSLSRPSIRQLVDLHRARHKRIGTMESSSSSHTNAIHRIRSVIKTFYFSITENSQHGYSRAVAAALLIAGRIISSVLSLFLLLPSVDSIKSVLTRYVSRGFEPIDAHDAHGLCLAEEIFHQIGLPFFADTNYSKPLTLSEVLRESPYQKKTESGGCTTDDAAHAISIDIMHGFERLSQFLEQVQDIIRFYLEDETVAFSTFGTYDVDSALLNMPTDTSVDPTPTKYSNSSSYVGNSTPPLYTVKVWMAEEENSSFEYYGDSNHQLIQTWTFGRLLKFLAMSRFTEHFWDFCLTSYAVMTNINLCLVHKSELFSREENNECNSYYHRYTVDIAIMAPITCTVSDLTVFTGNAAYSRFFADFLMETKRNSLGFRRDNSQSMSILSINSHEPEDLRQSIQFGCSERKSSSSITQRGSLRQTTSMTIANLDGSISVEKPGLRRVIMRARQNIAPGEELRFATDEKQI